MDVGQVQADQRALQEATKAMTVSADVAQLRAEQEAMAGLLRAKVQFDQAQNKAYTESNGSPVTVNVSGLLLSNSPAGKAEFAAFAESTIRDILLRTRH
jgi:hypothetical protein